MDQNGTKRSAAENERQQHAAAANDRPNDHQAEARDGVELARHGDPSLNRRRASLLEKTRDRSGLHWLPATEVIRRANTTVARSAYGLQARAGAAIRNAALHPAMTTRAARDRVAKLGTSRPIRSHDTTGTREGISR